MDTIKGGNNRFQQLTDRHWRTLDTLQSMAEETGRPPAQIALAWASSQPGITSLILGASKVEQLRDNLASLDIRLTADQLKILHESSMLDPIHPNMIMSDSVNRGIFGGATVQGR